MSARIEHALSPSERTVVARSSIARPGRPPARDPQHGRRWWVLGIVAIAQLMVVLDATIVNIALPSAQAALHFSAELRQWAVTSYALAFGSLLLLGGRIGDVFGRTWAFIAGAIGFAVASAAGGAAQSFAMLIAARAAQGAFAALLAPSALAILTTTFSERSRALPGGDPPPATERGGFEPPMD